MCDKGSIIDISVYDLGTLYTYDLMVNIIDPKIMSLFKYIYALPWLREYVLISERETHIVFFNDFKGNKDYTQTRKVLGKLGQGRPYMRDIRTLVLIRITWINIIKKMLNSIMYTSIYILD